MPAEADPALALLLAKEVADVYGAAVDDMLRVVARTLASGASEPGWETRKLVEVWRLRARVQAIIDRLASVGEGSIADVIREAWDEGVRVGAAEMAIEGSAARFGTTNVRAVNELVTEAVTRVRSTYGQILREVLDVYRDVVYKATGPMVVGTRTRQEAIQAALDAFADRGIRGFIDRRGRRWEIETYAEMAVRTAAARAQIAGTLDRFVAAGRDLVICSDHPRECPKCRPWEGRVLSITGATPPGTVLEDGTVVAATVATAQAQGWQHPNCRHNMTAYVVGLTEVPSATADPPGWEALQQQRALERRLRRWRRRQAVAITPEAARYAAARAREVEAALAKHVRTHGLRREPERERARL